MVYTFLCVLVVALAAVFMHNTVEVLPPLVVLTAVSLLAIVVFHSVNVRRLGYVYRVVKGDRLGFLRINLLVLLFWGFVFYGLKYLEPGPFAFVAFTSIALFPALMARNYGSVGAIALSWLAFVLLYRTQPLVLVYSLLAVGTGVLGGVYFRESELFNRAHRLSPVDGLCVRFYGAVLVGFVLSWRELLALDSAHWETLALLSFLTLIVPAYFSQRAVHSVGAQVHGRLMSLIPFATYTVLLVAYGGGEETAFGMLFLSLLVPLVLNWDVFSPLALIRRFYRRRTHS